MPCNVAPWDRNARIILGLALLALGWGGVVTGTVGTVFKFLGFVPLLTGLSRFCPLYSVFGFSTNAK